MLAYQPVGPNVRRLLELIENFPATHFATIVDNAASATSLSRAAQARLVVVELLLDIDCGMRRTGLAAGPAALELYRLISELPGVQPGGLHAYDGHIHDRDPAVRKTVAQAAFAPTRALRARLLQHGFPVPRLVAGGSPTFPLHARDPEIECSPGTCLRMMRPGWILGQSIPQSAGCPGIRPCHSRLPAHKMTPPLP